MGLRGSVAQSTCKDAHILRILGSLHLPGACTLGRPPRKVSQTPSFGAQGDFHEAWSTAFRNGLSCGLESLWWSRRCESRLQTAPGCAVAEHNVVKGPTASNSRPHTAKVQVTTLIRVKGSGFRDCQTAQSPRDMIIINPTHDAFLVNHTFCSEIETVEGMVGTQQRVPYNSPSQM